MHPFNKYLREEDKLQIQVKNYITWQYPFAVVHHSPNEGKRTDFEKWLVKVLGLRSGFPDLVILAPNTILFIELKTEKTERSEKGKKRDSQIWWIETLQSFGFAACFCFGFEEAKAAIDKHLKPLK